MSNPHTPLKLGWFSTGGGEGSRGLLLSALTAIESGTLNAVIEFVFCNRELGEDTGTDAFLATVSEHGIPVICFSSTRFAQDQKSRFRDVRSEYDSEVVTKLSEFTASTCVLAGYMLIVSPLLSDKYQLLNLHPAKPSGPVGTWKEVIDLLIDERATESGIMIHLATKNVDQGPVVSYCTFTIRDSDNELLWKKLDIVGSNLTESKIIKEARTQIFTLIRSKQLLYERPFFVETLKAFANKRIAQRYEPIPHPLNLTDEVNKLFEFDNMASRCQ